VVDNIKRKAGKDFPIIMRMSGDEHFPGGRDLADLQFQVNSIGFWFNSPARMTVWASSHLPACGKMEYLKVCKP
jgi:2,4-dienoyl-CoA reductase-like NADH-dependent reductase (Old Yellow Enzyme family)